MNDLISRQAAIDAIEIAPFDDYDDYKRALDLIERLPSAEPELKHGKWLKKGGKIVCSECGTVNFLEPTYCPHCGAKMDEKEKNNA